ncbi:MAG: sulfurtransferase complex subunit TusC [Granulosicoccus sp.]|nr:sulfurtransferase complex subunit TusC [Granulosicoccus sp.]
MSEQEQGVVKKFLYVNRRAPHGTNYAQEGLEVALIGAAFDQDVMMAYVDDGVFQLKQDQDTAEIGTKNFSATFGALGDYDIQKMYVERESLAVRGMSEEDLMPLMYEDEDDDWAEKPMIHVVSSEELAGIINDADVVLNF